MKQPILVRILSVFISLALLLSPMFSLFAPTTSVHAQVISRPVATIAFHDSQSNIWVVNEDGTNAQQITNKGRDCCAAWSPDGSRLYFLRFPRNGLSGRQGGGVIMTYDFATGSEQPVGPPDLKAEDSGLAVSPEGTHLAFTHNFKQSNPQDLRSSSNCLAQLSVITGEYEDLQCGGPWASPSFSPDGTEIVATNGILESVAVTIYSLTSRTHRDIGCCTASGYFPDGQAVLVRGYYGFLDPELFSQSNGSGVPGQTGLFRQDLATTKLQPLLVTSDSVGGAAISPDGMRLVYTRGLEQAKTGQIEILDLAAGTTKTVTKGYGPSWRPVVTVQPTTDRIAYVGSDKNVWLSGPNGSGQRRVTQDASESSVYSQPKWSPTGDLLAFARGSSQYRLDTLLLLDVTKSEPPVVIAKIDRGFDWSPDGRRLLYADSALWTYDVQTKQTTRLLEPRSGYYLGDPDWSPSGKFVSLNEYLIMNPDITYDIIPRQFAVTDLKQAGSYKLFEEHGDLVCDWSPDGQQLACVDIPLSLGPIAGPCPLTILDINQSLIKRFPTTNDSCDIDPRWSPDGRFVAVQALIGDQIATEQKSYVDLLAIDGSERIRLGEGIPQSWSPDGKRLVILDRPPSGFANEPGPRITVLDRETKTITAEIARGFEAAWQPAARGKLPEGLLADKEAIIQFLSAPDFGAINLPAEHGVGYDETGARDLVQEVRTKLESHQLTPAQASGFQRLKWQEDVVRDTYTAYLIMVDDLTDTTVDLSAIAFDLVDAAQRRASRLGAVGNRLAGAIRRKIGQAVNDWVQAQSDISPLWRTVSTAALDHMEVEASPRASIGEALRLAADLTLINQFKTNTQGIIDRAVTAAQNRDSFSGSSDPATQQAIEQRLQDFKSKTERRHSALKQSKELLNDYVAAWSPMLATGTLGAIVVGFNDLLAVIVELHIQSDVTVKNARDLRALLNDSQILLFPNLAPINVSNRADSSTASIAEPTISAHLSQARIDQQVQPATDEFMAALQVVSKTIAQPARQGLDEELARLLMADERLTTQLRQARTLAADVTDAAGTLSARSSAYQLRGVGFCLALIDLLSQPDDAALRARAQSRIEEWIDAQATYQQALSKVANGSTIRPPDSVHLTILSTTLPDRLIAGQPFEVSVQITNLGSSPAVDAAIRVMGSGVITSDNTLLISSVITTPVITRTVVLQADRSGNGLLHFDVLTAGGVTDEVLVLIETEDPSPSLPISPIGLGVALSVGLAIGLTVLFVARRRRTVKH